VPSFDHGSATIHYDDEGATDGFPVLLLAPGGMRSCSDKWTGMPWNPRTRLEGEGVRLIGMDQRNAGRSRAPVSASTGWADYRDDQLALLDHLGIERCQLIGMCIGGPFIINLLKTAPARFAAAVLLQPVGVSADNRPAFYEMFDAWASEVGGSHPEAAAGDWTSFRSNMWDGEFVVTASPDEVAKIDVPMLVMMGNDLYHPSQTSRTIAEVAPNVTFVETWKDEESLPETDRVIKQFLASNR
jgi:pimeloyl-ACP methyl ester carboxylesterase